MTHLYVSSLDSGIFLDACPCYDVVKFCHRQAMRAPPRVFAVLALSNEGLVPLTRAVTVGGLHNHGAWKARCDLFCVLRSVIREDHLFEWCLEPPRLEPWGFQAPFKEVIFSDDTAENTEEVATSLPGAMIVQPTDGYCSGEGNQPFIGECQDCKNTRGCPHGLSMAEFDNIIAWASIQKNS